MPENTLLRKIKEHIRSHWKKIILDFYADKGSEMCYEKMPYSLIKMKMTNLEGWIQRQPENQSGKNDAAG